MTVTNSFVTNCKKHGNKENMHAHKVSLLKTAVNVLSKIKRKTKHSLVLLPTIILHLSNSKIIFKLWKEKKGNGIR